jgi:hypothetical protein
MKTESKAPFHNVKQTQNLSPFHLLNYKGWLRTLLEGTWLLVSGTEQNYATQTDSGDAEKAITKRNKHECLEAIKSGVVELRGDLDKCAFRLDRRGGGAGKR